jgi:hypothetical protein
MKLLRTVDQFTHEHEFRIMITQLQQLFNQGEASPFDMDERGETLLHVSAALPLQIDSVPR